MRGRRVFSGYHCALGKEEQVLLYDHQKSSSTLLAWLPALTGKQGSLLQMFHICELAFSGGFKIPSKPSHGWSSALQAGLGGCQGTL